ncbi:MAG TPA: ABC transporter permease [Verrucomicrobiae bacterium]|nr:ABC transporter permease [Verrucomicrobiae bacterium]
MLDLPVTVYSPESPLKNPGLLLKRMFRDLIASRGLAWRLFVRDRSAQFRQSVFGYIWAFVPPLIASLPFVFLNANGVVSIKETPIPYPAFAIIGTLIWQVFVDALNTPLKTVAAAKPMLTRINFPREALLLSGLATVLFNFLIRLVLLVAVMIWFKITPPSTIVLFPLGILALICLGFTIGVLLTPLGLLYNDIQQMIPMVTMFLMFLTPVVYPKPSGGFAGRIMEWNPVAPLITASRDWLTTGSNGNVSQLACILGVAILLSFVGWVFYRLALPHIISRSGN